MPPSSCSRRWQWADERTNDALVSKIHSQFDAWVRGAFAVPVIDVDGVAKEGLIYRYSVGLQEQEMKLMDVKSM